MTVVRVPAHAHRLPQERRRRKPVMMFLSEDELRRLDEDADAVGMNRSTYIRWRLLYGGTPPKPAS
jgi:hypothetical protein